ARPLLVFLCYLCILSSFFLCNVTASTDISSLSLHDALPISFESLHSYHYCKSLQNGLQLYCSFNDGKYCFSTDLNVFNVKYGMIRYRLVIKERNFAFCLKGNIGLRSEEHTSELQSRFDLVCRR